LFCAVTLVYASARIRSRGAGSWSRLPAARDSLQKNSLVSTVKIYRNIARRYIKTWLLLWNYLLLPKISPSTLFKSLKRSPENAHKKTQLLCTFWLNFHTSYGSRKIRHGHSEGNCEFFQLALSKLGAKFNEKV
jgi:hypothetical protein